MKFNIQNLTFIIAAVFSLLSYVFSPEAAAQSSPYVRFTYDDMGNRTGREIVVSSSSGSRMESVDTTAIKDQLGSAEMNLYPNPVLSSLKINIKPSSDTLVANGTIRVLDVTGREVQHATIQNNEAEVDFSTQATGLYIVVIEALGSKKEWKVVKE